MAIEQWIRKDLGIFQFSLSPILLSRAVLNAEIYTPQGAVDAGFLDVVIPEEELMETAMQSTQGLTKLEMTAHCATKLRVREVGWVPPSELSRKSLTDPTSPF